VKWLRIFVADIYCRLVEEGVCDNRRRPKTINIHHRQGAQTRSRQAPIPMGRPIEEPMLFDLAKNLLAQVVVDGRAWPCAMISLSVGGFEDGITGNKGIGGFLLRGEDAKALRPAAVAVAAITEGSSSTSARPSKRRKIEGPRINNFFLRQEESTGGAEIEAEILDIDDLPSAQPQPAVTSTSRMMNDEGTGPTMDQPATTVPSSSFDLPSSSSPIAVPSSPPGGATEITEHRPIPNTLTFTCPRCQKTLLEDQQEEHQDWHFAQELAKQDELERQTQLRQQQARNTTNPGPQKPRPPAASSSSSGRGGKTAGRGRGRPPGSVGATRNGGKEKGQKTLAFGS
jgi:DNA polymerase eta